MYSKLQITNDQGGMENFVINTNTECTKLLNIIVDLKEHPEWFLLYVQTKYKPLLFIIREMRKGNKIEYINFTKVDLEKM